MGEGIETDEQGKAERAAYMRQWRAEHPEAVDRAHALEIARQRAARRVAAAHPEEFATYLAEERRRSNIPARRTRKEPRG